MNQQAFQFQHSESLDFCDLLAEFDQFGSRSIFEKPGDIPYFINEFWTARQRQASNLHEVSYRACFKPQLPRFFIDRLTEPGDLVYDPFMGRGTTLIEAGLAGRVPLGNDSNPLSRILAGPRLKPIDLTAIQVRLAEIPFGQFPPPASEELLVFYHPETLADLQGLRGWLLDRQASGLMDDVDRWIQMVAINRLTGHSSGFFSVYTLPPNQAVSVKRQAIINQKRNQSPPRRDIPTLIMKKSRQLLKEGGMPDAKARLYCGPADQTRQIADDSIALTVTSPPFLDVVDYQADNWLRCWFAGIEVETVAISHYKKLEDWQDFVRRSLTELARITRPGGHIAFEVGEVRGGKILLEEAVIAAAQNLPLDLLAVMINQQDFTKTANCWGVSNNSKGTNSNRIVIFRKSN